jgi:enamine deaminase RidA (YjgF/YER057c/UK114 family)
VGEDIVSQSRQALRNIVTVLAVDGATPEHLVRLTWYVTSRAAYQAAGIPLGVAYRQVMGKHYPAMTAVEVTSLMEAGALVEIEATAVVP